jgi:hypothetical protein
VSGELHRAAPGRRTTQLLGQHLSKDLAIDGQILDPLPQSLLFGFQLHDPLELVRRHAAVISAPHVVRGQADAAVPGRFCHGLACGQGRLHSAQHLKDLFWGLPLAHGCSPGDISFGASIRFSHSLAQAL